MVCHKNPNPGRKPEDKSLFRQAGKIEGFILKFSYKSSFFGDLGYWGEANDKKEAK